MLGVKLAIRKGFLVMGLAEVWHGVGLFGISSHETKFG